MEPLLGRPLCVVEKNPSSFCTNHGTSHLSGRNSGEPKRENVHTYSFQNVHHILFF